MATNAQAARSMLVTGGARGLGAAIAHAAIAAGYRVGVVDVVGPADAATANGSAGGAVSFVASVSDERAIESVLDQFGTPDVVVNNAGIVRFGPLVDHALDDFRTVVDVNLVGTYVVARAVARRWMRHRARAS